MVSLGEGPEHDELHQLFNARVDDRIDRKNDKLKLWIAGALLMNLTPILVASWWGGSTLTEVQTEIRMLSTSLPQTVTRTEFELTRQELMRRADHNADRIKELERKQ